MGYSKDIRKQKVIRVNNYSIGNVNMTNSTVAAKNIDCSRNSSKENSGTIDQKSLYIKALDEVNSREKPIIFSNLVQNSSFKIE